MSYVNPTREQFKAIFGLPLYRPVHMINLLRFRDFAAYRDSDPEASEKPVTAPKPTGATAPTRRHISLRSAASSCGSAHRNSC
jgi:hypothetical protein